MTCTFTSGPVSARWPQVGRAGPTYVLAAAEGMRSMTRSPATVLRDVGGGQLLYVSGMSGWKHSARMPTRTSSMTAFVFTVGADGASFLDSARPVCSIFMFMDLCSTCTLLTCCCYYVILEPLRLKILMFNHLVLNKNHIIKASNRGRLILMNLSLHVHHSSSDLH